MDGSTEDEIMRRAARLPILVGIALLSIGVVGWVGWQYQRGNVFVDDFHVDRGTLSATGRNPYYILEPGYRLSYAGGGNELIIMVLDKTELVDGVTTRVVEERETRGGGLVEVSRNFYAIDPATKNVYYFGEDVDDYAGGRIVGHGGAWRSGSAGARFGLMMPGEPSVGAKHYQEIAPDVAMDRAEIVSNAETIQVPAGALDRVLKVRETSPLEQSSGGDKYYAPGIGLVVDGGLALVRYGAAG